MAMAWLNSVVRRLLLCLGSFVVVVIITFFPIPFVTSQSLTQEVIRLYMPPSPGPGPFLKPGEGFRIYFQFAIASAFILDHAFLVYQLLPMLAPPRRQPSRGRRLRVMHGCIATFGIGILAGNALIQPTISWLGQTWRVERAIGLEPLMSWPEFWNLILTVVIGTALAFELPALMAGLVWLGIVSRDRLASWRKYAVLLAFTIAAFVTPTRDMMNQATGAAILYVPYELGLLLARCVPASEAA